MDVPLLPTRRTRWILSALGVTLASGALLGVAYSQGRGWLAMGALDRWSAQERAHLASMQLSQLEPARPDPSNRHGTSPAAALFGKQLFNDTRFSSNGLVSCATCHNPLGQFEDGKPLAVGVAVGQRRTMPVVGLQHNAWFFWDGRKDSLWAQALGPLEDPKEHGSNRLHYVHLLQQNHRTAYEALFGPMPDLRGLPKHASPAGSATDKAAWARLDPATREKVSRVFANMGKAIAAYETTLRYGESRVDRYIQGVVKKQPDALAALTEQEKEGLRLFIGKGQCITCHSGPLLTDHHFHNTGIPPLDPAKPERARAEAVHAVQADEFNCLGPFSDARPQQCEELRFIATNDPHMLGAFKTPSLRNVALRPPYMHAGQLATLTDVLRHYARAPESPLGHSELRELKPPIQLTDKEIEQLLSLLKAFSGPVIDGTSNP